MAFGRQVSREILVYSLGSFLSSALLYLAVPIYTRIFPPEEYSRLAFIQAVTTALAAVLVLGGDTALSRFWFDTQDAAARRSLTVTWIGFLTAWSFAVTALVLPFSGVLAEWGLGSPDLAMLFVLGLAALPVVQLDRMLAQVLRNQFRAPAFAITSVVLAAAVLMSGLVLAVAADLGVPGILAGVLVGEGIVLCIRAWLVRGQFRGRWARSLLPDLLRFAVPLVPVSVSYWVISSADRIVVGALAGAEQLGYYAVATSVVAVFAVLLVAIGQAWLPRITQLYEVDRERAAAAAGRALTLLVAGLGVMAAAISGLAPFIVAVVSGPSYEPAAESLPLLTLGAVAFGTTVMTSSGLTLVKRTGPLALGAVTAAAANVAAAVLLVPAWGTLGAAVASAVGYALLTGVYLALSQRSWAMRLERGRLLALLGALVVVVLVCTVLGTASPLWRWVIPVAYGAFAWFSLGCRDRDLVRSLVTRPVSRS